MFVFAANLISEPCEIGVFPKPIAIQLPSVQKAISPTVTTLVASASSGDDNGAAKYISSPQVLHIDSNGIALRTLLAVGVSLNMVVIENVTSSIFTAFIVVC